MNILFFTCDKVHSTKGGTERTTITAATALTNYYNYNCFSIYERAANTPKELCFVNEFHWILNRDNKRNIEFLHKIITSNRIDCVIVQGSFIHVPRFRKATVGTKCKVIFAHHFQPRWELVFGTFKDLIKEPQHSITDMLRLIKNVILFPYRKVCKEKSLRKAYYDAYQNADRVILLSQHFIQGYKEFGSINNDSKFRIIPNGLSFTHFLPKEKISQKKNIVLIVSRLDECQKRLSLALQIWSSVKEHTIAKDWSLLIVGHGDDRELYEHIIQENNIEDVELKGRCDPIPYYEEASLFMMTSKSESWGLTITEAQQMGCVPLAFNTYESLPDIITDSKNGYIIEEGNCKEYVDRIISLMSDSNKRNAIAENAIQSSSRFTQECIAKKWWQIIEELTN